MKNRNVNNIILLVLGSILIVVGAACVIYAIVMQCILSYHKFGVIITEHIFIPHWSAWFYFGIIPTTIGAILAKIE